MGHWMSQMQKPRVLILTGPTCIGKTELSLDLAQQLNGEVISADSVQVYRGLDIGSSKVRRTKFFKRTVVDCVTDREDFSAGVFYRRAREVTSEILSRGKVPIVVGGTGFYLKWFVHGPAKTGRSTEETRKKAQDHLEQAWNAAAAKKNEPLSDEEKWNAGIDALEAAGDKEAAQRIALERNNYYRLIRALEIVLGHEEAMTDLAVDVSKELDYDFRCFFLHRPRLELYDRIEVRCEEMVRDGLLEEAQGLLNKGLMPYQNSATRAIGYRQAMESLLKMKNREIEVTEESSMAFLTDFKTATRKLVKQQITWFRNEGRYNWVDLSADAPPPKEQIMNKWSKLSTQGSTVVGAPPLNRAEEQALKRYTSQLHFYRNPAHRRDLVARIRRLAKLDSVPVTARHATRP